jgi:hypothetical protein
MPTWTLESQAQTLLYMLFIEAAEIQGRCLQKMRHRRGLRFGSRRHSPLSLPIMLWLSLMGLSDLELLNINVSVLWAYLLVVILYRGPYEYVPKSQRRIRIWARKKWGFLSDQYGNSLHHSGELPVFARPTRGRVWLTVVSTLPRGKTRTSNDASHLGS